MIKAFQEKQTALFANGKVSGKLSLKDKRALWPRPSYIAMQLFTVVYDRIQRQKLETNDRIPPYDHGKH